MNKKISFHSEHERATLYSQRSQNEDFGYKPLLKDLLYGTIALVASYLFLIAFL